MEEKYITLVREYAYKKHRYAIVQGLHDMLIRAIDYKYLDDEGKLTKSLNGLEMFCDDRRNTVAQIIERINDHIDWREYVETFGLNEDDEKVFAKACVDFFARRGTA